MGEKKRDRMVTALQETGTKYNAKEIRKEHTFYFSGDNMWKTNEYIHGLTDIM